MGVIKQDEKGVFKEMSKLGERLGKTVKTNSGLTNQIELWQILQTALDVSFNAIYLTDLKGNLIYVNTSFLRMNGYDHKNEVLNRRTSEFWGNDEECLEFMKKVYRKGSWSAEQVIRKKDGTLYPVMISANTIFDNEGNPVCLMGAFIGVKEPIRNEKIMKTLFEISSAHNSTKKLSELFHLIHRSLGSILDATNFFIAMYDKATDAISFPYFKDEKDADFTLIRAKESNSLTAEVIQVKAPRFYQQEELKTRYSSGHQRPQGTLPKVWLGVPLAIKGEVIGAVGVQSYDDPNRFSKKDITLMESISEQIAIAIDRKRTVEALRASESKYRDILESIQDGYYELDLRGRFTFFNRALTTIFDCSQEELDGAHIRAFTDERTNKIGTDLFNKVYTSGNPISGFGWKLIRKDGEERHASTSVSLLRDAEGRGIGFQGIIRDMTDQKRLEIALQQTQKMEAIGTLAGGIAHNFNNLLMGIQGNISLMLLDMEKTHTFFPRLTTIEKLVQNGSKLTSQLLGYAREGRYQVMPIDINQLVLEMSETFSMTKKEIRIHPELSEEVDDIMADHSQFEQIMLNLLINAAEAMPKGGDLYLVTKNVTHRDMDGQTYKPKPGEYVMLSIKDTGEGMDRKTLDRIFDPFFTTKGPRGTGLGLASVYGIVKAHRGYIDVHSKKGSGTTFNIFIPATRRAISRDLSNDSLEGIDTILLVDDEPMILEIGEEMLGRMGYRVLVAQGGEEALHVYEKEKDRVGLVILDMILPDMNGGEVYDRLKEIDPHAKVLLASGYSIDGQASEILDRGCDGFIQKPFNISDLSKKIKETVAG